jgi:hypothetical protein
MLSTSGTSVEPEYPVGTCTITMRFRPSTLTTRVLDPDPTAVPQPPAAPPEADDVDVAGVAGRDVVDVVRPPLHAPRPTAHATAITSHRAGVGRARRGRAPHRRAILALVRNHGIGVGE